MKKIIHTILGGLLLFLVSCSSVVETGRQTLSFNDQWHFYLGDEAEAAHPAYNDAAWRLLNLPHDWAIEGEFSEDHPSGTGGGALPGGVGWYRKHFNLTKEEAQHTTFIDFDGVYMNSEVYLNGTLLGKRPNGYLTFRYELTPYLKEGENVVAVRVDNSDQPNSRWYSGCGIYRNVWLTRVHKIHVDLWGTYVTTPSVTETEALFAIETTLCNQEEEPRAVKLRSVLKDEKGREVAQSTDSVHLIALGTTLCKQSLRVVNPSLWSVESPNLYTLHTEVYTNGALVDTYETTTAARYFHFDAEKGFFLNGKSVKINGACMHHDLGCLGAAVNYRAIERQLEILKAMGCNGIRTAHNQPAPELLDLCNKMGFIVMDETFDMWRKRKTQNDYARYFDEWYERDLRDMMLRDRNHPSIFMWCVGNEVLEQWSDASADTLSLEEANLLLNFKRDETMLAHTDELSVNSLLCQHLVGLIKSYDTTRPVTAGCNEPNPNNHLFKSGALDIIGFNYHDDWFLGVPENFPGKPFIVSESVSGLMTRGYYRMPSDETILCPERWDKPYYDSSFACSSYDNCHVPWGNSHEGTLKLVKENDFISGQYIWTGFDYLGEPTPYGWPARSSYFGIVDLAGFPKDIYYLYQSEWSTETVLHLFPHWNWTVGQTIDLWAYYNNADEVELFLNGRSMGSKKKTADTFHVMWRVTYEPGTIKAISRKNGKVVAQKEIHTAGESAKIRLTPDRTHISADGKDLTFVTVEVVDEAGTLSPHADNLVQFEVSGSGFIAGVDNGSQTSLEPFKAPYRKAFNGKCLVVIQNDGTAGQVHLKATSAGLKEAAISFTAK